MNSEAILTEESFVLKHLKMHDYKILSVFFLFNSFWGVLSTLPQHLRHCFGSIDDAVHFSIACNNANQSD